MALLNYTTAVNAWQTVSEIQQILAKSGVSHFSIKNEDMVPVAVSFTKIYNGNPLNYLLPCNVAGIKFYMQNHKETRDRLVKAGKMKIIDEHALNVGWRIVKDWIEAQSALIDVSMATMEEVFLPYLIVNAQGETLAKKMLEGGGLKQLNF